MLKIVENKANQSELRTKLEYCLNGKLNIRINNINIYFKYEGFFKNFRIKKLVLNVANFATHCYTYLFY
jgi:hypothetical protein